MSKIEVNAIEPQSGTTLTIGASGDTVALAAGAISSGFSRTGAVNWNTTIQTTGFTASSPNGYFCNTTSAAFTVTLPATASVGDIVAFSDYAQTFNTNNLTLNPNGLKVEGSTGVVAISTQGASITLVYADSTNGWIIVSSAQVSELPRPTFVTATGGTITTCGNYKIHTFTGPGTFTVSSVGNPAGSTTVDYLVVAGGAGGGSNRGGGGGAGGYRESVPSPAAWTASPLANPGGALPVSVTGYPITVGSGGAPGTGLGPTGDGGQGSNSIFSTITSAGGGFGRAANVGANGTPGGSGGGASYFPAGYSGGTGNTPPVSPPQGNSGGSSVAPFIAGGGGGASVAGGNGSSITSGRGGAGGNGATSSINGTPTARAGGGGGGSNFNTFPGPNAGDGGSGGGGAAGNSSGPPFGPVPQQAGIAGTVNTGGGGGGGGGNTPTAGCNPSGAGGSGIVIIRYKFQ
jgi:hypothetical protein